MQIERENNNMLKHQMKAMDACAFLPDYLLDECFADGGMEASEDMQEYMPSVLYMQQMLRVFPAEQTAQYRLFPAFAESFLRIEEAKT